MSGKVLFKSIIENSAKETFNAFFVLRSNPCAGVGVARAIRLSHPNAILIVVDDGGGSAAGGMCDPVFNQAISVALMSVGKKTKAKKNECGGDKFNTLFNLLDKDRSAYFLPVSYYVYICLIITSQNCILKITQVGDHNNGGSTYI